MNKSYVIERDDISQLCVKLGQWTEHLNPSSAAFRFVIVSKGDESGALTRENISSYPKFLSHDFSSTWPISCFEIYFNFMIANQNTGIASSYSVNLDLHGFCLSKDGANAMVGHEPDLPFSSSCAEVRIEYVDYLVSRNIEMVIKDWFAALPVYEVPVKPKWVPELNPNYRNLSANLRGVSRFSTFRTLFLAIPILIAVTGDGYLWDLDPSFHLFFGNFLFLALCAFGLSALSHFLFVHISNNAWPRGLFPTLSLNIAGTRQIERHQKILQKGRGFARELGYGLVVSILSTIVVSAIVWSFKLLT
jgi:hypothetical protein